VTHPRTGQPVARGRSVPPGRGRRDRRTALADWLTAADNPFFAKSVANRVWYHLFGRGIVEPADDSATPTPPAHDALLDALAKEFVDHKFDLRHLVN